MSKLITNHDVLLRAPTAQVRRHIDDRRPVKFLKINYDDKKIRKVKKYC
jgi:hypothetical protein